MMKTGEMAFNQGKSLQDNLNSVNSSVEKNMKQVGEQLKDIYFTVKEQKKKGSY